MNKVPVINVPMESLVEVILLQLNNGGRATLTVTGSSMMPLFYSRRDSVVLVPVDGKLKNGEIILYRRENGQYVLHRIVRLEQDYYICSGDNQYDQEIVRQEQLIGVVDTFCRNGKVYHCDYPGYRLYKAVWIGLFPLRREYIWVRRRLGRLRWKLKAAINRRKR